MGSVSVSAAAGSGFVSSAGNVNRGQIPDHGRGVMSGVDPDPIRGTGRDPGPPLGGGGGHDY